ncbi:hypothetical protein [Myroides fluvii]|uniref:hypothetical protein n=1 Tax=Myroides fluvii TaxID=2572594 RepID=UPI00131BB78D|nr:hypothetical protein [Myroides fluvii]
MNLKGGNYVEKMQLVLLSVLVVTMGVVGYSQQKNSKREVRTEQNLQYEVVVQSTNARITSIMMKLSK